MTQVQRVLSISAAGLIFVIAGCGAVSRTEPQPQQRDQQRDSVWWHLADKNLLGERGLVAGRHGDTLRIYSADNGALLAEGEILQDAGPVEVIGFSPEGEHLFYVRDATVPGRSQLRVIAFSQGVDRELFSVQDYVAYELVFDPPNAKVFMVFGSPRNDPPNKIFQATWAAGEIRDITEIRPEHAVLGGRLSMVLFSLSASGERLYTHVQAPPGWTSKLATNDRVFYLDVGSGEVREVFVPGDDGGYGMYLASPVDEALAAPYWHRDLGTKLVVLRFDAGGQVAARELSDYIPDSDHFYRGEFSPILWTRDGRYLLTGTTYPPVYPSDGERLHVFDTWNPGQRREIRPPEGYRFARGTRWQWVTDTDRPHVVLGQIMPETDAHREQQLLADLVEIDLDTGRTEVVVPAAGEQVWVKTTISNKRLRD